MLLHFSSMVASRNRRADEHKLLIASFRRCRDFVKACSKARRRHGKSSEPVARVAFNQKSLAGVLVTVPLKTIVGIRFLAGIVVLKGNN